jgi:zinc transport system ATP-binding protein
MARPIIDVDKVSFDYNGNTVLENVTFTVEKGDFLAIVGQNGSGKTTLLKLILGLLQMQKGAITLCGSRIERFRQHAKIGYVPQKATNIDEFFPATVREIVGMSPRSTEKHVTEALKTVGMLGFENRRIGELSGGQQQRIFIARAIINSPDVLFLDEPTTGVDSDSQKAFYELLHQLNEKGMTIVLITHDIASVTKYVNKLACLNKTLVFHGTHEQFCNSEIAYHYLADQQHMICHIH